MFNSKDLVQSLNKIVKIKAKLKDGYCVKVCYRLSKFKYLLC
jgi:hypothetical protein